MSACSRHSIKFLWKLIIKLLTGGPFVSYTMLHTIRDFNPPTIGGCVPMSPLVHKSSFYPTVWGTNNGQKITLTKSNVFKNRDKRALIGPMVIKQTGDIPTSVVTSPVAWIKKTQKCPQMSVLLHRHTHTHTHTHTTYLTDCLCCFSLLSYRQSSLYEGLSLMQLVPKG